MRTRLIGQFLIALTIFLWAAGVAHCQIKRTDFLKPQPLPASLQKHDSVWKPWGTMTKISVGVCAAGTAADLITSRNGYEGNGVFRNPNGSLQAKKATVFGVAGCAIPFLWERKLPRMATAMRFALGGARMYFAIRNTGMPRMP